MGRKQQIAGLQTRYGIWQIDKTIFGKRICESTGTSDFEEAQAYLAKRIEETRQATVYGVRPKRLFREAAIKFLEENQHLASIDRYARVLKTLDPFIGELPISDLHLGALQQFINHERSRGIKTRTINYGLQTVRRITKLAADEWLDEYNLTWLLKAPKIKLLPDHDKRAPYPLSWDEQDLLIQQLPEHLKQMALFAVNTGCREAEICQLQWNWEVEVPDSLGSSVFIVPKNFVKNREERLIVLNKVAQKVINTVRGQQPTHVFSYRGKSLGTMLNAGWIEARKRAGLPHVRVHDLKHTFGRRLRSAGVSFEDRQDLLGHKSGRITTHYSMAELKNLFEATNKVCQQGESYPTLALLKRKSDYVNQNESTKQNVVKLKQYANGV